MANVEDSALILIVLAHIMEGVWIRWLTIRGCVIDSDSERDLPSSSEIVDESWLLLNFEVVNNECRTISNVESRLSHLQICNCGDSLMQGSAISSGDLELNPRVFVRVAKRT